MGSLYRNIVKPLFFRLDAEAAHHAVFAGARLLQAVPGGNTLASLLFKKPAVPVRVAGISFPNRVGVAAGFDKNARIPELLFAAGFGHVEIGSITARASAGNPRPRLFRLPADEALINRMGLNNDGAEVICRRLSGHTYSGIVGINLAKTHDPAIVGDAAIRDYLFSFEQAVPVADYLTLNISCPNTTEGKTFEDRQALSELLEALTSHQLFTSKPVFIKLSADLTPAQLDVLTGVSLAAGITGFVAVNTRVSRDGLTTPEKTLAAIGRGGLSGKPVAEAARNVLKTLRILIPASAPVFSVGGISSPEEAQLRFDLGADLVQLYTGLIYEGPDLGGRIAQSCG